MASEADLKVIETLQLPAKAIAGFTTKAERGAVLAAATRCVPEAKRADVGALVLDIVTKAPEAHHEQVSANCRPPATTTRTGEI